MAEGQGPGLGGDALAVWAERTGRRSTGGQGRAGLRFAFYGRVPTEDHQDPVTSRARQREQAAALVAGRGRIVAEFFDIGQSRALAWARRPQAAALVAALADPDRGWDAVVIVDYERAFYGGQYAAMAPLFDHYGVELPPAPVPGDRGTCMSARTRSCPGSPATPSCAQPAVSPRPETTSGVRG